MKPLATNLYLRKSNASSLNQKYFCFALIGFVFFFSFGNLFAQATDPNSTPPGAPLVKNEGGDPLSRMIQNHPGNAGERVQMANVTIIESQSFNGGHAMDNVWFNLLTGMGHMPTISPQSTLDNTAFFGSTDLLIISSGVIALPAGRIATIQQFMQTGKPVYIQGEYLPSYTSNIAFSTIVNNTGGTFAVGTTVTGQLNPTSILNTYATTPNNVANITYHWYGCRGSGCNNIEYFMNYAGNNIGFVYCPISSAFGDVISSTDQDWVNTSTSLPLMQNIIFHLLSGNACSVVCGSVLPGQEIRMNAELNADHGAIVSWEAEFPLTEGFFRLECNEQDLGEFAVDPSGQSEFSFEDAFVPNENLNYRLAYFLPDGQEVLTDEISLDARTMEEQLHVGEDDAGFRVWVLGNSDIRKATIIDMDGKSHHISFSGMSARKGGIVEMASFPNGLYVLRIEMMGGAVLIKKLLWQ